MEVYQRFRLPDGRLVERLVETLPVAAVVVGENYYRNYEPVAPQHNFGNHVGHRKAAVISDDSAFCCRDSRYGLKKRHQSWKRNRKRPWHFNKKGRIDSPPFRLLAPELAEAEAESIAFCAEMKQEIISSLDYW